MKRVQAQVQETVQDLKQNKTNVGVEAKLLVSGSSISLDNSLREIIY